MFSLKFKFCIVIFIGFSLIVKAQSENKLFTIPSSIYSSTPLLINLNSKHLIEKRLNLNSLKFAFLDVRSIEEGYFNIPICNSSPTEFMYDSYNKLYANLQLKKAFFKVSDLYKARRPNKI